ncbi:ABC transporter substrate-binding protein [Novosphingobium flavum]|uniref:ABC transporter substrate-binding protein n=1 Tax=Novosphingobium flavum TaxID=1778672 RepID=A0A7X1KMZ2_9SPHN|nr:putative urea ABC transporter substrate-binding protein [Novosphingobium flavum]MBC2666868.1 ABC transporter substrate-binding protein [Novosphingobium flavum]
MTSLAIRKTIQAAALASMLLVAACGKKEEAAPAPAAEKPKTEFNIGWSIYAGWMPWPYAEKSGILKKWADKYGIKVNLIQVNDYVESVNQYTAGKLDGVAVTNMDALTIPAAGGKDTTALIMGDYSNGNDGIVMKAGKAVGDLKGQTINLVELSVSHYLLARALELNGMKLADVKTVNTSDADIVSAFATAGVKTVVTWNPQLAEVKKSGTEVFDSSKIPNEIQDLMSVSTETLKANPALGKALVGAWFETLALMQKGGPESEAAIAEMAKLSGTDVATYKAQLKTTFLYYKPADAVAYVTGADIAKHEDLVRQFSFSKGLFGPNATSVDAIGIELPGGKVLGDKTNVKLRFDPTYMKMAADGTL